jgi:hypothetical protein
VLFSPGWIRRRLFGIAPRDWAFDRRGFPPPADPAVRAHLERIIGSFVEGYHATLEDSRPDVLLGRLDTLTPEYRGFAFEGVAVCLTMYDRLFPWKQDRWLTFQLGPGNHQSFLLHVGYGLALARMGRPATEALTRLPNAHEHWLAIDGYGFHEGFFRWKQYVEDRTPPPRLTGYPARVFDQGLGRVMWFGCGAEIDRVARTVASFPEHRHPDLWSGLGVACTYAGGVGEAEIKALAERSAPHQAHLIQGSIFSVKLRHRAGNVIPHTEMACRALSGLSVAEAVQLVDSTREALPPSIPEESAYEALRCRVQEHFAALVR